MGAVANPARKGLGWVICWTFGPENVRFWISSN